MEQELKLQLIEEIESRIDLLLQRGRTVRLHLFNLFDLPPEKTSVEKIYLALETVELAYAILRRKGLQNEMYPVSTAYPDYDSDFDFSSLEREVFDEVLPHIIEWDTFNLQFERSLLKAPEKRQETYGAGLIHCRLMKLFELKDSNLEIWFRQYPHEGEFIHYIEIGEREI